MPDSYMPTTIPSPVDRGEFNFYAVDADGREWRWDDEEMVWEVETEDGQQEPEEDTT